METETTHTTKAALSREVIEERIKECARCFEELSVVLNQAEDGAASEITWFVHKCQAGYRILSAYSSYQSSRAILRDAVQIYQEICAWFLAYQQHSPYSQKYGDQIAKCQTLLGVLRTKLNVLCQDLDAQAGESSPAYSFRMIAQAGGQMKADFEAVQSMTAKWRNHMANDVLDPFCALLEKLLDSKGPITALIQKAKSAADSCDAEEQRTICNELCHLLVDIQKTYIELSCKLDALRCLPDIQPPFFLDIETRLARSGYAVAEALRYLEQIKITEETLAEKLCRHLLAIEAQTTAVQEEIYRWAECQLCVAPDACSTAIEKLRRESQTAHKLLCSVSQLEPSVTAQLQTHTASMHATLLQLACQIDNLQNFPTGVLDKFWWHIASLRILLSPCEEETDCCLLTEQQVLDFIKKCKEQAGGSSFHVNPAFSAPPLQAVFQPIQQRPTAILAQAPDPSSAQLASASLGIWDESKNVARHILLAVEAPQLQDTLTHVIDQIEQQEQQLQTQAFVRQIAFPRLSHHIAQRWNEVYTQLTTTHTVALDRASELKKQQLMEIQGQLRGLNKAMQEKLGQ